MRRQVEYNYENESELYQSLYKSGAFISMQSYLDPNRHEYTSVIGKFAGIKKNKEAFSWKMCKSAFEGEDLEARFAEHVKRLARRKGVPISGNWGYCQTNSNIYFCGQF